MSYQKFQLRNGLTPFLNRARIFYDIATGPRLVQNPLKFDVGYIGSPNNRGEFHLDPNKVAEGIRAFNHGMMPIGQLDSGLNTIFSLFYPADNTRHDRLMEYYRQREWRIVGKQMALKGKEVMYEPLEAERKKLIQIDPDFFNFEIRTDTETFQRIDRTSVYPGINGKKLIKMARRVIVPTEALSSATNILASITDHPPIVCLEEL